MIEKTYAFVQDGQNNAVYTLTNENGMQVDILTYGARIIRWLAPNRQGEMQDIIVGCATPEGYYQDNPYFGATVGRYANRIGGARFTLHGKAYALQSNEKGNILHGGTDGDFSRKIWNAEICDNTLVLSLVSPDGESGFPGNLQVKTYFTLTSDNALEIRYEAVCDQDTVCNLTNHAYFNLGGRDTILDHTLWIDSAQITACDDELIPHGEFVDIAGSAFSFDPPKPIGKDIFADEHLLTLCNGYDFNYVLRKHSNELTLCATLCDGVSGRKLDCFTTQRGLQIYTGNYTGGFAGKKLYQTHCAVCLETQAFPNSPNCPNFPSALLRAGEKYEHTTVYQLSIVE